MLQRVGIDLSTRVRTLPGDLRAVLNAPSLHPRVRESVSALLCAAASASSVTDRYGDDAQTREAVAAAVRWAAQETGKQDRGNGE